LAYDVNSWLLIYKSNDNYVKRYPVRYNIKKPGGFPPKPPGKPTYDKDGEYTDNYACKLASYKSIYNKWEEYCKPWEEIFGIPFEIINELDYYYLRRKRLGIIKPIEIEYDNNHPIEDIIK